MGFKTLKAYNAEKFDGLFLLRNDGDFADVVFMYRCMDDVLVADTHYIKSGEYSGYVHCLGHNCPACAKEIRVQEKLFIPLYNIAEGKIQFFDRSMRFHPQLLQDVFSKYENPSEVVFRIIRHGVPNDVNTSYEIVAIGRNNLNSYDKILAQCNVSFPEHYEEVCRTMGSATMHTLLNPAKSAATSNYSEMPDYQITPRGAASAVPTSAVPASVPGDVAFMVEGDVPPVDVAGPAPEFVCGVDLAEIPEGDAEIEPEDEPTFF